MLFNVAGFPKDEVNVAEKISRLLKSLSALVYISLIFMKIYMVRS